MIRTNMRAERWILRQLLQTRELGCAEQWCISMATCKWPCPSSPGPGSRVRPAPGFFTVGPAAKEEEESTLLGAWLCVKHSGEPLTGAVAWEAGLPRGPGESSGCSSSSSLLKGPLRVRLQSNPEVDRSQLRLKVGIPETHDPPKAAW